MYCGASSRLREQLLHRLLLVKSTVRKHRLKQKKHEHTLTSAVCKVIYGVPARKTHQKIIVELSAKIIFYIVDPDSVNLRHSVPPVLPLLISRIACLC